MPLTIRGEDFPAGLVLDGNTALAPDPYAALIDARRRVIANAWARSAYLYGPYDPVRFLANDTFVEGTVRNSTTCPYPSPATCTPMAVSLRDRTEVYAGWDYLAPESVAYVNDLNRISGRELLYVPPSGGDSMLFAGMHFRFYTGPAPSYPLSGSPRWSTLPAASRPRGQETGFLINGVHLHPDTPAARGYTNPLTLTAYERATIVLLGGTGAHDSVSFYIDPSVTRPHIAAWTEGGSTYLYARCGANVLQDGLGNVIADQSSLVTQSGAVLDLTSGCSTYWRVVAVNSTPWARVMNVRVGASTSAGRMYNLVVGTEAVAGSLEMDYIRRAMRQGAWRFYGTTGGTHVIRTFSYQNGSCTNVHVCFHNRTSCRSQTDFTGGTPTWALNFCSAFGSLLEQQLAQPGVRHHEHHPHPV